MKMRFPTYVVHRFKQNVAVVADVKGWPVVFISTASATNLARNTLLASGFVPPKTHVFVYTAQA